MGPDRGLPRLTGSQGGADAGPPALLLLLAFVPDTVDIRSIDAAFRVTSANSSTALLSGMGYLRTEGTRTVCVTNPPPTADPGGPYLTAIDTTFTADGSASSDPDGDPLICAWTFDGSTVAGGGWFDPPAGAYASDPTGNTAFVFTAGDLDLRSTSYELLVVNQSGGNAQLKGGGTTNGTGDCRFMVWAGGGAPDTFRISIW